MQLKEAELLRKNWTGSDCSHSERVKEYINGTDTGDYVCITFGKEFTREEHRGL